jgi:hypothetical protein
MSKKICFDKNTFIIGIIMIIFILLLLSYSSNFKYINNNDAQIHNLINKKILNIKDKMINNNIDTCNKNIINNHRLLEKNKVLSDLKIKQEDDIKEEINDIKQDIKHNIEYDMKQDIDQEMKHNIEYDMKQDIDQEMKQDIDQEMKQDIYQVMPNREQEMSNIEKEMYNREQDIDIDIDNNKINFKNNINNRINYREAHEIIKYKINDEVQQRDLNVLLNPIYPPLARVERPIFDNLIRMNFGQTTRGSEDTFRLMGYLVNTNKNDMDMGGNLWKLFGRQTYRGSSIGEFYVSPVNDHTSDMKIFLKNEMMPKNKIRDIYSLPSEVYLESPFFSKNAYTINELPKSDFNSNYL